MMMKRISEAVLSFGIIAGLMAAPASASTDATEVRSVATSVASKDAVPAIAPPGADKTAVYLDSAGRVIPATNGPSAVSDTAQIGCTPISRTDEPHYSGGDVSGHGWWNKGDCSNNRADVYNCLYEYYNDGTWRQKACSSTKRVYAGGGSANRTVARAACDKTYLTSWRNHVDVDVVDEIDTGEQPFTGDNAVPCRVF
jgi:hypothetical protein